MLCWKNWSRAPAWPPRTMHCRDQAPVRMPSMVPQRCHCRLELSLQDKVWIQCTAPLCQSQSRCSPQPRTPRLPGSWMSSWPTWATRRASWQLQGREPGCPQSPRWTTCWTASRGTCRSWESWPRLPASAPPAASPSLARCLQPWAKPGTPSISPVPAAGRSWTRGPSSSRAGGRSVRRIITRPSPRAAPTAPAPSARKSSRPWTRPGTLSTSSAPTVGRCLEMRVCAKEQRRGSCPRPRYPCSCTSHLIWSLPCLLSWVPPCPCPTVPSVSHPHVGAHPNPLPAGFLERNGKPYCHQDFLAMFAPKCQGCERPVIDNYLSALQGVWHTECFVCTECLTGFTGGSFFELEGRPYCELHFHQRQGTICHGCGRPVSGRCITAAGRRYHPEHFICSYCLGRLHKGTFCERGDKMYCQPCHDKLFL